MLLRRVLLAILVGLFVFLGLSPLDRETWVLESTLFVMGLSWLVASRRWLPLSTPSCLLVFAFLVLHEIGAHYTYSLVPYKRWLSGLAGPAADAAAEPSRNHYDRFVHFAFGLLLGYPMRELLLRAVGARGAASYVLTAQALLSCSALYELIEWAAATVFGAETGAAYVGAQGDEWDAQKDMLLAGLGTVTALLLTAAVHHLQGVDAQRVGLEARLAAARTQRDRGSAPGDAPSEPS